MPIKSLIADGEGAGIVAGVTAKHRLKVETQSLEPTFTVAAIDVGLDNAKSMLSLFSSTDSRKLVVLREMWVINVRTTTVTGVITSFEALPINGHSGGSLLVPVSHDALDKLCPDITVRTGATVVGEGKVLMRRQWSSDEWGVGVLDQEGYEHAVQNSFPFWEARNPRAKPLPLRPGCGFHVKCATNTTAGTFDIIFVFTQEDL